MEDVEQVALDDEGPARRVDEEGRRLHEGQVAGRDEDELEARQPRDHVGQQRRPLSHRRDDIKRLEPPDELILGGPGQRLREVGHLIPGRVELVEMVARVPLSMAFSMAWRTSWANSSGRPALAGNSNVASRLLRTLS